MPPRKPLRPEEVKEEWREYFDFDRQESLPRHRILHIWATCPDCGKERWITVANMRNRQKTPYCHSCVCSGPRSPFWKGGQRLDDGYIQVHHARLTREECGRLASMIGYAGYLYEHRLMMARHLGRPLRSDEIVHHLNGVRGDNRLDNLRLLKKHRHHKGRGDNYYQPLQESLVKISRLEKRIAELEQR